MGTTCRRYETQNGPRLESRTEGIIKKSIGDNDLEKPAHDATEARSDNNSAGEAIEALEHSSERWSGQS